MRFYTNVKRKGNNILIREIDDGIEKSFIEQYEPSLYVRSNGNNSVYHDFFGGAVTKQSFNSMYEMNDFIKKYRDVNDYIWGNRNAVSQYIYDIYGSNIQYEQSFIKGAFIDIEVLTTEKINGKFVNGGFPKANEAKFPVNSICEYDTLDKKYHVWTTAKWKKENSCFPEIDVDYHYCEDEHKLLMSWIIYFSKYCPHYISGWNIETFDIPYLINRIKQIFSDDVLERISPWKVLEQHTVHTMYGDDIMYEIYGIETLDYMNLYKKYVSSSREQYKLDFIAELELGDKKKEFEGSHGEFYWNDPQGFIDYNLKDVELVVRMDNKLQLITLVCSLSYFAGINYSETFSPIRTWDNLIYCECENEKIAIPFSDSMSTREEYEGAYVFPTKNGIYNAVLSFDVESMYPNSNISNNIGLDTIISGKEYQELLNIIKNALKEHDNLELYQLAMSGTPFVEYYKDKGMPEYITEILVENNVCMTPNWQFFRTDVESIFTKLQKQLFYGRKSDKNKMKEYQQKAKLAHEEMVRRGLA